MHADLTPGVQTGLAWFYLFCCLMNGAFGYYQQRVAKNTRQGILWYVVAGLFLTHAIWFFTPAAVAMPLWLREMLDKGLHRGLVVLGLSSAANAGLVLLLKALFWFLVLLAAIDLGFTYLAGPWGRRHADEFAQLLLQGMPAAKRIMVGTMVITVLSVVLFGINAITFFLLSVVGFIAFIVWRRGVTEPALMWGVLNLSLIFGGWSMTDYDFRTIVIKPDNIPIAGMVFVVGFTTWLAFRKAVINDDRIAKGLPPTEKDDDDKVLVWPDLVYTELICMIVVTIVLVVWAVLLPAPIEQPASSTKTPFSSKAPWYFLGLQEMLVYYDPWIAGVVLPTAIIIGLMALPYVDFNQKGNGYYTFDQRPFAVITFLFGFILLWVTLIFLGTFLRGPNWNFFGPYEHWDTHKVDVLNNVYLSEYFWIQGLGIVWDDPGGKTPWYNWILRESPGVVVVLAYFLILPPLLAKTAFRNYFIRMGFARYFVLVNLLLLMASLPIKMILRWVFNLKYIVAIPEIFFNI